MAWSPGQPRHGDVHDHHVREELLGHPARGFAVGRLADHFEIGLGVDQATFSPSRTTAWSSASRIRSLSIGSPRAGRARVGTRTKTVVPPPGVDSIWKSPADRLDPLLHPGQPQPPSGTRLAPVQSSASKPTPSSSMMTSTSSARRFRIRLTRPARACLATLVSASCTTR